MKILIERIELETESIGTMYLGHNKEFLLCKTLELPWRDNKRNVSCIAVGDYLMVKEATSPKHKYEHFRILNVYGRSGILIHIVNYVKDLKGCIGVGSIHKDLNLDSVPDVADSTKTLEKLYSALPEVCHLKIIKP